MNVSLVVDQIWEQITTRARKGCDSALVAVAYFGIGGSKLLPLAEGSSLVVDFSDSAVKSGQTCPAELVTLIRRGVAVYNAPHLHAKVFIFKAHAFIGSTNVSRTSANVLVEATLEVRDQKTISAMRRFVRGLCFDLVTLHEAKQKQAIYRPPKFAPTEGVPIERTVNKQIPALPKLYVIQAHYAQWDDDENAMERSGKKVARNRLRDTKYFQIAACIQEGICPVKRGDTVVLVFDGPRSKMVCPPAKVIHLQSIPNRRPKETMMFLEQPRRLKRIGLDRIEEKLGPIVEGALSKQAFIKSRPVIAQVLALWPPLNGIPNRKH